MHIFLYIYIHVYADVGWWQRGRCALSHYDPHMPYVTFCTHYDPDTVSLIIYRIP